MKRKLLPLVLLVVVTLVLCHICANRKSDVAFRYPDLTGVSSSIGRQLCRVSKEDAQNMTTRALVETVMTYPYLIDLYAFDSADLWFRQAQNLPMIQELLGRKDGLKVLEAQAASECDVMRQMDYYNLIGCIKRASQE